VRRLAGAVLRAVLALFLLTVAVTLLLRWVPVPISSMMAQRQLSTLFDKDAPPLHYDWVPLEGISPRMALAVIAAEDQLFADHKGFDMEAIGKALKHNQRGRRVRGASTISQQVAKNLFLWPGRSYLRKGLEAGLTLMIEGLWPKRRILEVYLNIAEFGDGIYGVGAASRQLMKTDPDRLSRNQAARLAAILPSPKRYSARNPGPYVQRRTAWIERQMSHLGGEAFLQQLDYPTPKTRRKSR
jgi:monofunctional biosynthetic peptidoglycan transglycosylase